MENEVKIIPPEGYEIDKENSTFECVKFKPKIIRWIDKQNAEITGFFIGSLGSVIKFEGPNNKINRNVFATEKQAKSAVAMAQLSQIIANDERFGGPITDEEWKSTQITKFCIERQWNKVHTDIYCGVYHFLAFHTATQRNLFLKENEDLIKDYLML